MVDTLQTSSGGSTVIVETVEMKSERAYKDGKTIDDYISIPQFYAGRSIFITGGTGFMGKALVEKLLRSCPDIKNIYLLIRPKRGQQVSERLCELLNHPVFAHIRQEQLNKVIPIAGNIASEDLGISEGDQATLCRAVSIVFHSAASVRFNETLKAAVTINMLGTKRLVELCHRMMSLEALIHVSTAYCNCDRTEISEAVYPPPYCSEDIASIVKWLPEDILEKLTPSLIGRHPNTYTFTKALAEHMLLKEAGNLPVVIVRPSIVVASLNEPTPGWVDNSYGPTGLLSAIGKGLLRICSCRRECVVDLIPVDIVINLMIASAWHTATQKSKNFLVYNCVTGYRNPIKWGHFVDSMTTQMRMKPLEDCILYPYVTFCTNKKLNAIHGFFVHYIPAYVLDLLARLAGRKAFVVRIQNQLSNAVETMEYFCRHQWRFKDTNVQTLLSMMSEWDCKNFSFDIIKINWEQYFEKYSLGIRKHLFKQQPETLRASRKRMITLYFLHQFFKVLTVVLFFRFVLFRSKWLSNIIFNKFLRESTFRTSFLNFLKIYTK